MAYFRPARTLARSSVPARSAAGMQSNSPTLIPQPLKVGEERPSIPDIEYLQIERPTNFTKQARVGRTNIVETYNPDYASPNPASFDQTLVYYVKNLHRVMFHCRYTNKWYFWQDPLTGRWLIGQRLFFMFVTLPLVLYLLYAIYEDVRFKYAPYIRRVRAGRDERRRMLHQEIEAALAAEAEAVH